MAADNILQNAGAYVPTTNIWDDAAKIEQIDVKSPEFKEILVRLYQNLNLICNVLNVKDSGYYNNLEFINSQLWFPNPTLSSLTPQQQADYRTVYRLVINFGVLPAAAGKAVAHGITCTNQTTFTRIYGAASDTTGLTYIPLPYASAVLANNIELNVDATNVNVITAANYSNYDTTYIILEYLQS